ncbi:MAG: ribonuclease P protein component [Vicinamibacteria bacterium]|nr:ribonuclease P protein component [Vicinamibacteria bacterium]
MNPGSARFGRNRRIRKSAEFGLVLRTGRRGATPLVSVAIVPAQGPGRIGISASVKVGGSVKRNRARRLVREYYRKAYRNAAPYDIVVNLKPGFAELSADEVRKALDEALSKAIATGKHPGRCPHPVR